MLLQAISVHISSSLLPFLSLQIIAGQHQFHRHSSLHQSSCSSSVSSYSSVHVQTKLFFTITGEEDKGPTETKNLGWVVFLGVCDQSKSILGAANMN